MVQTAGKWRMMPIVSDGALVAGQRRVVCIRACVTPLPETVTLFRCITFIAVALEIRVFKKFGDA
jgi:hypothetical protein